MNARNAQKIFIAYEGWLDLYATQSVGIFATLEAAVACCKGREAQAKLTHTDPPSYTYVEVWKINAVGSWVKVKKLPVKRSWAPSPSSHASAAAA